MKTHIISSSIMVLFCRAFFYNPYATEINQNRMNDFMNRYYPDCTEIWYSVEDSLFKIR
jgi:hypothetical protein